MTLPLMRTIAATALAVFLCGSPPAFAVNVEWQVTDFDHAGLPADWRVRYDPGLLGGTCLAERVNDRGQWLFVGLANAEGQWSDLGLPDEPPLLFFGFGSTDEEAPLQGGRAEVAVDGSAGPAIGFVTIFSWNGVLLGALLDAHDPLRAALASGEELAVSRGGKTLATFSLAGSAKALRSLDKCPLEPNSGAGLMAIPSIGEDIAPYARELARLGLDSEAERAHRLAVRVTAGQWGAESAADEAGELVDFLGQRGRHVEAEVLAREVVAGLEASIDGAVAANNTEYASNLEPGLADALLDLGRTLAAQSRYAEAIAADQRALPLLENQGLGRAATAHQALGEIHRQMRDYTAAEAAFRRALDVVGAEGGADEDEFRALYALADVLQLRGRYDEAEPLLQSVLQTLLEYDQDYGLWWNSRTYALGKLHSLELGRGGFAAAESYARQAFAYDKQEADQYSQVPDTTHLFALATALTRQGRLEAAEATLREAMSYIEQGDGPASEAAADTLARIAEVLWRREKPLEAEAMHRKAIGIYESLYGADTPAMARRLLDLGNSLSNLGLIEESTRHLQRALAIYESEPGERSLDLARALARVADLRDAAGRHGEAAALYTRVLALREAALGAAAPEVATTLTLLSGAQMDSGDFDAAERHLRRALEIEEQVFGVDSSASILTLDGLADLRTARGDHAAAIALMQRALAIRSTNWGADSASVGFQLKRLGRALRADGRFDEAIEVLQGAVAIDDRRLGPDAYESLAARTALSAALLDNGDAARALALSREAAIGGRVLRFPYLDALWRAEPDSVAESFEAIQGLTASEAGDALQKFVVRFTAGEADLGDLVRREQDTSDVVRRLEESLASSVAQGLSGGGVADQRDRIADLTAGLADIRAELTERFPDYIELSNPAPVALADVQAGLDGDEAMIVIDLGREPGSFDHVFAVTSDAADWVRLETSTGEIAALVEKMRSSLELPTEATVADWVPLDLNDAHTIYRRLLGDLEPLFKDKAHLIFVLGGAISSLPPHVMVTEPPTALKDYAAASWLIKSHAITVLPSVSSLAMLRRAGRTSGPASRPFVAYADPAFEGNDACPEDGTAGLDVRSILGQARALNTDVSALTRSACPLPGSAAETIAIARALEIPSEYIFMREAATETSVKTASLDQFDTIFFATHGLVAGETRLFVDSGAEPALLLTPPSTGTDFDDGLLMASEIAALKLNANWVVLSACNTAAGGGEPGADALSGLARAFFYAGARSLLVSHWYVNDAATSQLMIRLFEYAHAHPRERGAEALRQAMLSVMNDPDNPPWAYPSLWAPFVLVGEPRRAGEPVAGGRVRGFAKTL